MREQEKQTLRDGEETPEEREKRIAKAKAMMAPKQYEERIAIMVCKKVTEGCPGSSCFWAFHEHFRSFAQYRDRPAKLWSFFHCGGCELCHEPGSGLDKKLSRLKEEGVYKVHLGVCIRNSCPQIEKICGILDEYGLPWEIGTH